MNTSQKRLYVKENVLTISEVTEILNVSRQMIREYVKKGDLLVAKETPNGLLFLKEDVMSFKDKDYYSLVEKRLFNKKEIHGHGITKQCVRYFEKKIKYRSQEIASIRIYFNEYESLLDGYFTFEEKYVDNQLIYVTSPNFVIEFNNNEEIWLDGCNCGYGGTGPHGSAEILEMIGIEKELINKLFYHRAVSYFKENGNWTVEIIEKRNANNPWRELTDALGKVYLFNGNLVLLEDAKNHMYWDKSNRDNFINKYIDFIPQPISVTIYTQEDAINTGHFKTDFGRTVYYQVILKDRSGREIWFQSYIDENTPISKQKTVAEILESIGVEIKEGNGTWSDKIETWLDLHIRINQSKHFEIVSK